VSIGQATAAIVELTAHRDPFAFRLTATEACPRRGRAFRVSRKGEGTLRWKNSASLMSSWSPGDIARRDSTFKRSSCRMKPVIA
jgi:hypothetical protein